MANRLDLLDEETGRFFKEDVRRATPQVRSLLEIIQENRGPDPVTGAHSGRLTEATVRELVNMLEFNDQRQAKRNSGSITFSGDEALASGIQRVQTILDEALAGEGRFMARQLLEERFRSVQDRPGARQFRTDQNKRNTLLGMMGS